MGTARKPVVLTMSALGAIALLSVGFASWEIRNTSISTPASGSISADTVVDKRLKIVGTGTWDNNVICFGTPSDSSGVTYNWLTYSGSVTEKLTATYTFKVACPSDRNFTAVADKFVATPKDSSTTWDTATKDNFYICAQPNFSTISQTEVNKTSSPDDYSGLDDSMKVYSCSVTITFYWGDHFKTATTDEHGSNPYKYYNSKDYSDSEAEDAQKALQAIKDAADNTTFSFTISVSITNS